MTPKEEAEDLVRAYRGTFFKNMSNSIAKQCALIAVDGILRVAFYAPNEIYEHYMQVKQEIEKL
jgi:hypothetical protein